MSFDGGHNDGDRKHLIFILIRADDTKNLEKCLTPRYQFFGQFFLVRPFFVFLFPAPYYYWMWAECNVDNLWIMGITEGVYG